MFSLQYLMVGGASLPFVAAPELVRLTGVDPADPEVVEAHAAAVERLLFGPP